MPTIQQALLRPANSTSQQGIAFCELPIARPLKPPRNLLLLILAVALAGHMATAEETGGIVRGVSGEIVTVDTAGPSPEVGDAVEFFFEIPGVDGVISVATGKVTAVEAAGSVKVKIENATGEVAKDQLARFRRGNADTAIPAAQTTPAAKPVPPPPQPLKTPDEAEPATAPSPERTLPPSVPFPTITPKAKNASPVAQEQVHPAAAEFVRKGLAQYSAGDIDGAIASYSSAIRSAPDLAVAYLNRANAFLYKPNFEAAIADANKALELKIEKTDDAYTIRGTARAGLGEYAAANADCDRALKINPKNALAYNNRANNKLRQRDYAGALADCNKSISLDSTPALPYYNRGFARTNLGDQAGAFADWKLAVQKQPSFGAELNPKIGQLEAAGIRPRQSAAKSPVPPEAEWTDLTNAPQKLVGTWQGTRHRKQYFADGTFVTDPHLVPNPPRAQWRVEGDRLTEYYSGAGTNITLRILSIDNRELVTTDDQGHTFRAKRISDAQARKEKAN